MVRVSTDKANRPIRTDTLPDRELPMGSQEVSTNNYVDELTIATVFRSSEVFTSEWVDKLYRGVARNLKRDFRFVCLTDSADTKFEENVEIIPLEHGWETKHSKLELFKHDLGRVLYFDLDTVIVGSLEDLSKYDGQFAMLRDFSSPLRKNCGSGVMAWAPGFGRNIYEAFCKTSKQDRKETYRIGGGRGDQLFINHYTEVMPHRFQDIWSGQLVSYRQIKHRCGMPGNLRVVVFHGKDKPNKDMLPCIAAHWK